MSGYRNWWPQFVERAVQTASLVCGTKNFSSMRLYSAPQLHRTIVAILRICPYGTPDQPQGPLPRFNYRLAQGRREIRPRASLLPGSPQDSFSALAHVAPAALPESWRGLQCADSCSGSDFDSGCSTDSER